MVSRLDIVRTAQVLIRSRGESAGFFAASRADQLLEKGDREGAQVWLSIMAAIEKLQSPETYSEREIYEAAVALIAGHGGSALYLARGRLDDCEELGDAPRVEMWKRTIAAIEELQRETPREGERVQ